MEWSSWWLPLRCLQSQSNNNLGMFYVVPCRTNWDGSGVLAITFSKLFLLLCGASFAHQSLPFIVILTSQIAGEEYQAKSWVFKINFCIKADSLLTIKKNFDFNNVAKIWRFWNCSWAQVHKLGSLLGWGAAEGAELAMFGISLLRDRPRKARLPESSCVTSCFA